MKDAKLDQIIRELNRYFNKYQYVFWYDPEKEFVDELETSSSELADLLGAKVLVMQAREQFKTKRFLLEHPEESYLIYAPIPKPHLTQDFLADMEHYSHIFSAKIEEIIFQQLQEALDFTDENRSLVRKHIRFFQAKERRGSYIRYYDTTRMQQHPEWGIITAIVKISQFDENELLAKVLSDDLHTDTNKYLQEFAKYGVLDDFWQIYGDYFGTDTDVQSLDSLLKGAFVTTTFNQLNETIPGNLNQYLFNNETNAAVFVTRFHDSRHYGDLYNQLSEKVWNECGLAKFLKDKSSSSLIKVTPFKQINELILRNLRLNFHSDGSIVDADKTNEIISTALKKVSDNFRFEYSFLNDALKILQYHPQYHDKWQDMLDDYVNHDYQIDYAYRKLVDNYNTIVNERKMLYQDLKRMIDRFYNNEVLNNSVQEWNNCFDIAEVKNNIRQADFFQQYVINIRERIVVIISDAFRFEAAKELEQALVSDDRISTEMKLMLTGLPSVTYMGMPALLPHDDLQWNGKNVLVNGKLVDNAQKRRAILQSYDENNELLELKDILKATSKEIKQMIAGKNVIYIYHNHVDAVGDSLKTENDTFKATRESINELLETIQVLRTNSVSHIIVTADHGYIYREATIKEQDKIDVPTKSYDGRISPRYLMSKDQLDIPGTKQTTLGVSLKNDDDTNVYYPKSVNVFKAVGGKNYVHGGSSLQEMVVPVLDLKLTSAKSQAERAKIKLASISNIIGSLNMPLSFYQLKPISNLVKPRSFKVYFKDDQNRIISNVATLMADRTSDNINEPFRINLTIQNRDYDRSADYYLVIQAEDDSSDITTIDYMMGIIN